jgi:kinesin family protein 5
MINRPEGWTFTVDVSYLEIYMERVNDLLDPSKENLDVKESKEGGVFVHGLSKEVNKQKTCIIIMRENSNFY